MKKYILLIGTLFISLSSSLVSADNTEFKKTKQGTKTVCLHISSGEKAPLSYCSAFRKPRIKFVPQSSPHTNSIQSLYWYAGEWSSCIDSRQSRQIVCKNLAGSVYDHATCEQNSILRINKPTSTQSCTRPSTSYSWSAGSWGSCTTSGTQSREATCRDMYGHAVNIAYCANITVPTLSQSCTPPVIYSYSWNIGNWESCNTSGYRNRTIVCKNQYGAVMSDGSCTTARPTTYESCNTNNYVWSTGIVSSLCENGYRARAVQCISTSGRYTVNDANCDTHTKPANYITCDSVKTPGIISVNDISSAYGRNIRVSFTPGQYKRYLSYLYTPSFDMIELSSRDSSVITQSQEVQTQDASVLVQYHLLRNPHHIKEISSFVNQNKPVQSSYFTNSSSYFDLFHTDQLKSNTKTYRIYIAEDQSDAFVVLYRATLRNPNSWTLSDINFGPFSDGGYSVKPNVTIGTYGSIFTRYNSYLYTPTIHSSQENMDYYTMGRIFWENPKQVIKSTGNFNITAISGQTHEKTIITSVVKNLTQQGWKSSVGDISSYLPVDYYTLSESTFQQRQKNNSYQTYRIFVADDDSHAFFIGYTQSR